ncbi:lytic transglycosylase domain-containing protein [Elioraea thermophila]|uniref:lytic transglycosylase domain-containing protein n=1 Tax=Elioraea thermophila TaxID=2185104 RepID=UPI0013009A05|nr:lytic transglycosylase domain-containing protein [Elioraea thermophila]
MPRPHLLAALAVSLLTVCPTGEPAARPTAATAPSTISPADLCRPAIAAAERTHGIPHALLLAIGRVESGRRDPETGRFGPWPWTINAEGTGQFFPTKEAAIAAVRALQARGVRSIDVGCMQVNLHHHPDAFASLEEAFDPARNADYAARFLVDLQARANSWTQAAAHYHSQTPELAEAYKRRVLAAWPEETRHAAEAHRQAQAAAWAARTAGGAGRIIHLAAPALRPAPLEAAPEANLRGRDLDSYRAAPIAAVRPIALLAQVSAARPAPTRPSR